MQQLQVGHTVWRQATTQPLGVVSLPADSPWDSTDCLLTQRHGRQAAGGYETLRINVSRD